MERLKGEQSAKSRLKARLLDDEEIDQMVAEAEESEEEAEEDE